MAHNQIISPYMNFFVNVLFCLISPLILLFLALDLIDIPAVIPPPLIATKMASKSGTSSKNSYAMVP